MGTKSKKRGTLRIVSWNVNGIRACVKKGFLEWLAKDLPDVLCVQETKASPDQVPRAVHERLDELGYKAYWHTAERKGYSGVATFCRTEPLFVTRGVPFERGEGRVIITEHGSFTLYNVYFPNGRQRPDGPDPERLEFKLEFYDAMLELVEQEREAGKNVVISGDWNTAHTEIDIARPKENENVTGFLPVEREALQRYVDSGFVDTFRLFKPADSYEGLPPEKRDYTWWTYRAGARDRNIGWRIDYHFVNREFVGAVKGASIEAHVEGSDHCPIAVELAV
ncbi:MAG: exodeoxyribonuclease III [Deltaproteobacteria bacterium]|nr:MAG: exodeoxyribonuclease III [Deltaproteobacteria bacterium]